MANILVYLRINIISLKHYIKLIRIHQWIKNLFLFIPVFFAQHFFEISTLNTLLIGFFAYSLCASAVYILNDYLDIEKDKLHPTKSKRPLASGVIPKSNAIILMVFLIAASAFISILTQPIFIFILIAYLTINILYSIRLKDIALLDVNIIAIGFLLRVIAGGILADVVVSKWLILMTYLLAMFLALAKRRDDVIILNDSGKVMRAAIKGYNLTFINIAMAIMAAVTIVSYIMYSISPEVIHRIGHDYVYISSFFVILGILRYMQITFVQEQSGSPTKVLLKDLFLQLSILGWILTFIILLYVL